MITFSVTELQSLHEAVVYYDSATNPLVYATVDKLSVEKQPISILTEAEVTALRKYIEEMEDAVYGGAFAPTQPSIVQELLEQ